MRPINTEKLTNTDELEADSNQIPSGKYKARLQYILRCESKNNTYFQFIFETNKIRLSNGRKYIIKSLMTGDDFKHIFFYEEYTNYLQALDKVFDIEVKRENGYPKLESATEFTKYDPEVHISIPKTKEDWSFYELSKLKNAKTIYFPDGSKQDFQTFIDEVEEFELNESIEEKEKKQDDLI